MTELILHAYDASPFTQRALRLLGIKGLPWRWVETPMMPPKDELAALTGGYRGTPVLQVGADVYIDSQLIARELERRYPTPPLYASGAGGLDLALVKWSDAFFRSGLKVVLAMTVSAWPEPFRQDRQYLFPDIDFETVGGELAHSRAQLRAHASLLEQQLSDGRAFLAGNAMTLADAQAHPFVWLARGALPEVAEELFAGFTQLAAWEARVASVGEGTRTRIDAATALAEAKAATPLGSAQIDPHDAQGLRAGMRVVVSPDDTRRGEVSGEVVIAMPNEVAVRREHAAVGTVVVHFPRLGYRVSPAS